ncbi:MAG: EF-Tu/IF-2/RF-3 family GTPase [Candidatus Hermodarchaeota archaeon]
MSEQEERNFIIGIFGDNYEYRNLIGQALGAPGTRSDIQFYNRLDDSVGHVFCALTPVEYPEKLKPFLQTLNIATLHILVVDLDLGLNPIVGEVLVGMDMVHQLNDTRTLVVISNITKKTEWKLDEIKRKLREIINTTSLKNTEIIEIRDKADYDTLKKKVIDIGSELTKKDEKTSSYTKVLIDHSFPVKGIGTVILGIVKKGIINSGQMLELTGYDGPGKKVIVRSIQKHDRNFKFAVEGDRVGLALKGNISPDQISRDNILVSNNQYKSENKIKAKIFVNQFYKPKSKVIRPGDGIQYFVIVETKFSPLKITEGDEILPGKSGEVIMEFDKLLFHNGAGLKGIITTLNRFENQLRIVGYFEQII